MQDWPQQVCRTDSRENHTHLLVLWLRRSSHGSIIHHVGSVGVGAHALGVEHIAALQSIVSRDISQKATTEQQDILPQALKTFTLT